MPKRITSEFWHLRDDDRQVYMDTLKQKRKIQFKKRNQVIKTVTGPQWYQVLSLSQLDIISKLHHKMAEDVLEDRAYRTHDSLKSFGLYPLPSEASLLKMIKHKKADTIQFLSSLYTMHYNMEYHVRRRKYPLFARFLISSIYNLSLEDMIKQLEVKFQVKQDNKIQKQPKKKKKEKRPESPYLEKLEATCARFPKPKGPRKPAPLPSHKELMDVAHIEEEPEIVKPVPKPKSKPPRKGIPVRLCDQAAGLYVPSEQKVILEVDVYQTKKKLGMYPYDFTLQVVQKSVKPQQTLSNRHKGKNRMRQANARNSRSMSVISVLSGVSMGGRKKNRKQVKDRAPPLHLPEQCVAVYNIGGVVKSHGQWTYMINGLVSGASTYVMVHGGIVIMDEQAISINCGLYSLDIEKPPNFVCDCIKWWGKVLDYTDKTRCTCAHGYDFENLEGVPKPMYKFFHQPTTDRPYWFDEATIMDTNAKSLQVRQAFEAVYQADSVIGVSKPKRKRVLRGVNKDCIPARPKPRELLKCVFKTMRRANVIATLPDAHRAPELVEWMRNRIYGPRSRKQIERELVKCTKYWNNIMTKEHGGWNHVKVPKLFPDNFHCNWNDKKRIRKDYDRVKRSYRRKLYERYAEISNAYWPTMSQNETPSERFRDVFFTYLGSTIDNMHYIEPFNTQKVHIVPADRRYRCQLST